MLRSFFANALSTIFFFTTVLAVTSTSQRIEAGTGTFRTHRRWRNSHHHHKSTTATSTFTPALVPTQNLTPDQTAYLTGHNALRMHFGSANLSWSDDLATVAQQWADGCKLVHSGGSLGPYGENLAAGTGEFTIPAALNVWAEEAPQYDPSSPAASHFTQMVWKSTTVVGCAVATCTDIFPSSLGTARYYVCEYYPAGNVVGQFQENVQA